MDFEDAHKVTERCRYIRHMFVCDPETGHVAIDTFITELLEWLVEKMRTGLGPDQTAKIAASVKEILAVAEEVEEQKWYS